MSIKIDLTASEVDRMMEVLKEFPALAEKHYRPVVTSDVKGLYNRISGEIPILTGKARDTFGSKVTGKGFRLTGRVGWYDKSDPWYINVVEYGAKSHPIEGRDGRLKIRSGAWGGEYVFPKKAEHPGFTARGFMMRGYVAFWPKITEDLAQANERIIADLAAI